MGLLMGVEVFMERKNSITNICANSFGSIIFLAPSLSF